MKPASSRSTLPYMLMSLTGNSIFGLSFLFSKLALNVTEPSVLLGMRFLVAFLLMNLLRFTGLCRVDLKGKPLKPVLLLGLSQPVIYFFGESYGIRYSSSSFAGIMIALIPIAGLAMGIFLLGELPTRVQTLCSAVSVLGVVLMAASQGVGGFQWKGVLFLLVAVVSGAWFNIHSRRISERFTAFERTYVMFGLGTAVFCPIALLQCASDPAKLVSPLTAPVFWASIAYLSCLSSIVAFLLLNRALDGLPVAQSLVFANCTTVISTLAGVLLLHEPFGMLQALGAVMTIAGVYGVNRFAKTNS